MLTTEDKEKIKQLFKECREVDSEPRALFHLIANRDPRLVSLVYSVCRRDDGTIDEGEAELLTWLDTFIMGGSDDPFIDRYRDRYRDLYPDRYRDRYEPYRDRYRPSGDMRELSDLIELLIEVEESE
ncbi:hypothetical protein ACE1B6_15360 [Aerosakkonemataceae cyanobacterium BLCC-F154]|uniref:Uncharacterized protein n=1 Tax=Floridaenema fluviatile BLCC-F154 TaxID=3153640 RepID=A0ABV4YEU2_9CYAN